LILIDSNILIDLQVPHASMYEWSSRQLEQMFLSHVPHINAVVFAEIIQKYSDYAVAKRQLDALGLPSLALDDEAGYHAGQAYRAYRQRGGDRKVILADFFIGGHAQALKCPILTRDPSRYRGYFPELQLITPETHP
jgi:predicted nucleic acid-binding protein